MGVRRPRDYIPAMLAAVHRSILFHDDSKLFVFAYVGLAVVLALWLGLFWLATVVGVHLVMEIVKQHAHDPRPLPGLCRSLWELKLDIGLVLAGLVIALYMGLILGAAGLGAAARVGAQAATRVGLWQRALRGVLLTVDDLALIVKARSVHNGAPADVGPKAAAAQAQARASEAGLSPWSAHATGQASALGHPAADPHAALEARTEDSPPGSVPVAVEVDAPEHLWGGWTARWSRGDWFSVAFGVICALLIMASPWLTDHTAATAWAELVNELRPFPVH
jgi:hypothetical protein